MHKRRWATLCLILAFLAGSASPALAHKVIVFSWVENGKIYVEGGFGGNRPAKDCEVRLEDDQGRVIRQGKTDDQGCLAFDLPQGKFSSLKVVVEAGPGHKGSWTLKGEELEQGAPHQDPPEALTKGPSPLKIGSGIALIFALAFLGRHFARRKGGK